MATEITGRVTVLRDVDGNVKFPRTVASAVHMVDGTSLEDAIGDVLADKSTENLATKAELALKADITAVPTSLSQLSNDMGYIDSIPDEYITETELENKGYLTEHQDISGKVDKEEGKGLSTNDYTNDDKAKLESLVELNEYIHPDTHPATMIVEDENHRFVTDEQINEWNNKIDGTYLQGLATEDMVSALLTRIEELETRISALEEADVLETK